MKTTLCLFFVVLLMACKSTIYIGQPETDFHTRNEVRILYTDRAKDSTVYKTGRLKKIGRYTCTYSTFINGKCTRIRKASEIAVVH